MLSKEAAMKWAPQTAAAMRWAPQTAAALLAVILVLASQCLQLMNSQVSPYYFGRVGGSWVFCPLTSGFRVKRCEKIT